MDDRDAHRLGLVLLFAASAAVYAWVLDYAVRLPSTTPACFFVFSRPFLAEWLDHPGGPLLCVGRFVRQFYHVTWLGSVAIAAVTTLGAAVFCRIRARMGRRVGIFHSLAPAVGLLFLDPAGTMAIGALVSGAAFLAYLALSRRVVRLLFALAATLGLYLFAGGYAWLFVAWVTAAAWLESPGLRDGPEKVAVPLLAVSLPMVAYHLFPISVRAAWLYPFSVPDTWFERGLAVYLVTVPAWAAIRWGRVDGWAVSSLGQAAQAALLVALGGLLLGRGYDPTARLFAEYQGLYRSRQWDAILAKAKAEPLPGELGVFFTNVALCHQGRLLEAMFQYPQPFGPRGLILDLPDYAEYGRKAMYNSDLYYEMGHINAAYKLAYNQVYIVGETYDNLSRVAACALVNGNDAVAAKYLRILERTLFHRDVASQAWRWLSDRQAADEHFAPLRARKPTVELEVGLSDYACLLALVDSNPNNHMALDYLTAWCLLDKASLPLVAAHVGRFREAGYPALPGHVQEALMVWERTARSRVDLGGYGYDPEVAGRLRGFEQRAEQFSGKAAAEAGLQSTYGGTYMYYYLFAQVPTEGALSSAWLTLGNELYARGQVDEAIGYYRQALARHPDFAEAHLQLGRALAAKGRTEEAMAQLRQARGPKGSAWPEGALELPSH